MADVLKELKDELGLDLSKKSDRLMVKKEIYRRNCSKFINELVKIEDKDAEGIVVPFNLWPEQEEALKLMEENRRIIILKSRQVGLSWEALAYSTHSLLFNPGFSVNTVSQTEGDSKELIRRVGFILRHLPNWLIVDEKGEEEEKSENITGITFKQQSLDIKISFPDGEPSVIKGFTSSPGAARSFTANIIILDEWAFHPMANEIWDAAYPTINRPTGGKVIGISTGQKGTLFEDMWNGAKWEFGAEKGGASNSFVGIFLPWDVDPRRDREWYEQTKADMPHTFRKEYPATPSDAFSAGKGAMFTEWNPKVHIPYGKSWYPPSGWRLIFSYDGGYNRAAGMWYAISPDGWIIGYREYYPSKKNDHQQAEDIRELSRDPQGIPEQIDFYIADTSCWAKSPDSGRSTIEIFESHGLRPWRQPDKDRIMGWKRVHDFLTPITDEEKNPILDRYGDPLARLRFTESCSNFIRVIPGLQVNPNKPDDLAHGQEDHMLDQCRYMAVYQPNSMIPAKQRRAMKNKREKAIQPVSRVTGY